jgi:hypothetical protein
VIIVRLAVSLHRQRLVHPAAVGVARQQRLLVVPLLDDAIPGVVDIVRDGDALCHLGHAPAAGVIDVRGRHDPVAHAGLAVEHVVGVGVDPVAERVAAQVISQPGVVDCLVLIHHVGQLRPVIGAVGVRRAILCHRQPVA